MARRPGHEVAAGLRFAEWHGNIAPWEPGKNMRLHMQIQPAHLIFLAMTAAFGVLLYLQGWTGTLEIVAAMLPLAGYIVFT
jgi:hypothetical protein